MCRMNAPGLRTVDSAGIEPAWVRSNVLARSARMRALELESRQYARRRPSRVLAGGRARGATVPRLAAGLVQPAAGVHPRCQSLAELGGALGLEVDLVVLPVD